MLYDLNLYPVYLAVILVHLESYSRTADAVTGPSVKDFRCTPAG